MALKNIGVLWLKEKEGSKFMSGTINNGIHGDITVMVFRNEKKESEKAPDYRIVMVTDDEKKETKSTSEPSDDLGF